MHGCAALCVCESVRAAVVWTRAVSDQGSGMQ